MTAASTLTVWHFAFALAAAAATIAMFAARDWRPRTPGDRALDDIQHQAGYVWVTADGADRADAYHDTVQP